MNSVCLATFNGKGYIKEQIESILLQLGTNDELIVSDDASTDGTVAVVKSIFDSRIVLLENPSTIGLIKNFERALKVCKGDIIFLADQDDVWFPNKIDHCVRLLSSYCVVQSDAVVVNDKMEVLYSSLFQLNQAKQGILNNVLKNSYVGCTMAFRRSVLEVALPFPKHIPMHDLWIGMIGELAFSTFFIQEPLMYYRRHNANVSQTGFKSRYSFIQKIKFRINLLKYFPLILWRTFLEPNRHN